MEFVVGELGYTGHVARRLWGSEPRSTQQLLRISEQLEVDGPIRIPRRTPYYRLPDRDSNGVCLLCFYYIVIS